MTEPKPLPPLALRSVALRQTRPLPIAPPPPFPLEVFPPDVRTYIAASAASARVPESMVALPFLTFAGATIGRQLGLDVGNGWIEYPTLWTAVVAVTGAGKTPGIAWARLPLDRLQQESWLANTRRGDRLDRFFATDTSIDTLARDLSHSPGLVIVRDELHGLLATISQYRGGSLSRQQYLSLWSAHPLAIARPGRAHVYVQHPVVGICGGIQPQLWHTFTKQQTDGTIERFLPLVIGLPRDYWNEARVRVATAPDVDGMVERFRQLRRIAPRGHIVTRSPEAGEVWAAWFNDNLDRTLAGSILHIGYYQKLPSQVARTALILHALWHPHQPDLPLSAETMTFATTLAGIYRTHIHRSLAFLGQKTQVPDPTPNLSERILRHLAEHTEDDGWMIRTRLYEKLIQPDKETFSSTLESLVESGFIQRRKERPAHSKRPAETFRLTRPLE